MENINEQIWDFVKQLNLCWTQNDNNRFNDLSNYLAPNMIAVTTSDRLRKVGRKSCVDSWKWFAQNTHIESWKESDPFIQIYKDTAIVSYCYEISFTRDGTLMHSKGWDTLTLIRHNNQWQVACDHFSAYQS